MKILAAVVLCLVSIPCLASCGAHTFADPRDLRLPGDSLMIVTHASSNDDARIATKFGVDEAIRFSKARHIPVIYLQDERQAVRYFMEDCSPDYWVYSEDGSIKFDVAASHVYIVGGHLELCLAQTLNDVLLSWAKKDKRDLTISYFMDGIFSNGKNIADTDPYYKDYVRFMGIVNYSRPAGEYFRKLTLLETMGVIVTEARQYDYLQRILPPYQRTLPKEYRVEIKMSDAMPKLLRRGQGNRPPVLRFEFLDSADNLSYLKI